jgi:hypothetical protein
MSSHHLIYLIGSKACAWTGALAQHLLPQSQCTPDEAWSMGAIVAGIAAMLALIALIRRFDAWHNYYR